MIMQMEIMIQHENRKKDIFFSMTEKEDATVAGIISSLLKVICTAAPI